MKKILFYIQLPPPIYGVTIVNKQVFESEKVSKNIKKNIIKVNFSKDLSDLKKVNIKKIGILFILWWKLLFKIITFRPKFIYYTIPPTGIGFYKELPNILLIKLLGVNPIFHLHGKGISDIVKKGFHKRIYQFCFSNSIIIHLSEGLFKSEFQNIKLKKTKYYSVPNGIKLFDVTPARTNKETIELLFLSNIQESKGIFLLLESFQDIVKLYSHVRLNIIGGFRDSETEKKFNTIIYNAGIEKNILQWGEKYGKEKHQLIANCDILIHPSFNDAFPLVILEAMQHGLAIIGSDQGAIPELIKPAFGIVFPTGDKKKLFNSIKQIIVDEEKREAMKINSKLEFFNNYTQEHFETRMANIFKQI